MVKINNESIYFKGNNREFMEFVRSYFSLDITISEYLDMLHRCCLLKESM